MRGARGGGERTSARELGAVICGAGVIALKLGQAASSRPDVIGGVWREELGRLVDDVPGFEGGEAIVGAQVGLAKFRTFETEAVAAASLGQVHKGVLLTGEEVAVKILRPGVREQAGLDLYILREFASFARRNFKLRSDLVGIVDEFGTRLWEEMDYRREAGNAMRFKNLYVGQVEGVYVPKVFDHLSTDSVLVSEWVDGDKPAWQPVEDAERLISIGVRCSLTQLLKNGFVHGDPHSGNIMRVGKGGVGGDLCYLDFGMCVEVDKQTRIDLIRSITHLVNRNYPELAKDFARLGFMPSDADTDALVPKLQRAFADAQNNSQLAELSFGKLADNLADLAFTSPIRIPVSFTILIRSLTILEGLALATRSEFKIIDAAYPFVVERLLEDESPELQQCLRDVLIDPSTGRLRWNRLESIIAAEKDNKASQRISTAPPETVAASSREKAKAKARDESIDRVVKFVLSERGQFLRDALTNELTEMLDASQLQAAKRVSKATNGLIPPPSESPDMTQLERAAALYQRAPDLFKSLQAARVVGNDSKRAGGRSPRFSSMDTRVAAEVGIAAWRAVGGVTERNARRVIRRLGNVALDVIIGPSRDGPRAVQRDVNNSGRR